MKTRNNAVLSLLFASFTWRWKAKRTILLHSFIFILSFSAFSQNLDAFRSAAAADGVKLIPFPSMQSDASSMANEVQRKKDEVQNYSYDVFLSQKDNLLRENQQKKQEIENVRKEKSDWLGKNPGGNSNSFDDEIKKKESIINTNNNKISELNVKLKNGADAFGGLADARARLREQFDRVLRELSSAKSSPSTYLGSTFTDDDKKKFENYISVIKDQIESQISEHRKQEDGAKGKKQQFEQLINKTAV